MKLISHTTPFNSLFICCNSFSKELIILHFSLVRSWFLSQKSVLQFADFNFHFFQDVLKSTRAQLEKEFLMDDVVQIEDMPSYSLLC